jgi:hypothetical protein
MRITLRPSSDVFIFNPGLHFEVLYLRAKSRLKGIEGFNLEHWCVGIQLMEEEEGKGGGGVAIKDTGSKVGPSPPFNKYPWRATVGQPLALTQLPASHKPRG